MARTAKTVKAGCPSSNNPSPSKQHAFQTYADFDKGTFEDRCKYCAQVARTGKL